MAHGKNKSRHQSGRGTATTTDEDMFQQRPRQQTSTSRSLSSPTTPNGFLDSCVSIEHFPGTSSTAAGNKVLVGGDRQYPVNTLHGLAESSGRDSDEDEDIDEDDEEEEEEVEMVDHACQTRESLFDNKNGDSVVIGPEQQSRQSYASSRGPTAPIQPSQQPSRVQFPLPINDSRYKAERTIEISQRSPTTAPPPLLPSTADARMMFSKKANTSSSAASSKSGADVVVLH